MYCIYPQNVLLTNMNNIMFISLVNETLGLLKIRYWLYLDYFTMYIQETNINRLRGLKMNPFYNRTD